MTPDISVNVSGKPRVVLPNYLYERECSFVNSVNLKSKHDFEAPNSEKWLGQTFGAEKILTVWGEGVARVDQNGNPVDVRNPTLPLAIETDKGLYLGVELLLPDPHFQCALSAPFENEVFDLSRCREKAEECSKNVERELFGALNAEFSRPPSELRESPHANLQEN